MPNTMLTIGDMASINNISSQTLRFYCNKNLIEPIFIDEDSGYRYFSISQSYLIDSIQFLQQLGLTLDEIKSYFEVSSPEVALKHIEANQKIIKKQQQQIKMIENTMLFLSTQIKKYSYFENLNSVSYEYIEESIIHSHEFEPIDFHTSKYSLFEYRLRELKKKFDRSEISKVYFYNASSVISLENINKGKFLTHKIFIHGDKESAHLLDSEVIEEGIFATIYFEDFSEESEKRDVLLKKIKKDNYKIDGDLICEPLLDVPFFKNVERKSLLRLRIRIKSKFQ